MNVLLVDYDTDSRAGVAEFLREMGHHVTERSDIEERSPWSATKAAN